MEAQSFEDIQDFYLSEEEISESFNYVQKAWMEYEDCENKLPFEDAIRILKKVENSIIKHGLFSPNESASEIATENLKYLLLPFYLADIFGRIQENRKSNLSLQKTYYDEFIKLCNHYELVSKDQRKKWKTIYDDANYEPSREDKIQGFKDKKELENQIKNIEKIKDEDTQRQILTLNIKTKILRAIEDIRMVHMENQIQAHKEKLEKERQQNPNFEDKRIEPKKMSVWHVPKAHKNPEQPYMISNENHGCHKCDPLYNQKAKEEARQNVFRATNQPTMSLAEYADQASAMFDKMEKNQQEANEARAVEEAKDQDLDEIVDRKTLEERAWDDWKDDNEKGGGNKKRY